MNTDSRGRPMYKLRQHGQTGGYSIAIPDFVARKIMGLDFAFELTEKGFSYEKVEDAEEGLPEWFSSLGQ